jgi:hypothetical protein
VVVRDAVSDSARLAVGDPSSEVVDQQYLTWEYFSYKEDSCNGRGQKTQDKVSVADNNSPCKAAKVDTRTCRCETWVGSLAAG